jgi:hypothetical protein
MSYRRLYLLVEGTDDELYASRVLLPWLRPHYDEARCWKYAQQPAIKTDAFLRSIKAMGADYWLLADLDQCPCVMQRREQILQRFPSAEGARIVVVVPEVESWYLAGLGQEAAKRLKVSLPRDMDRLTKERFDQLLPARMSRIDFMMEILGQYELPAAAGQNRSLRRLVDRCWPRTKG